MAVRRATCCCVRAVRPRSPALYCFPLATSRQAFSSIGRGAKLWGGIDYFALPMCSAFTSFDVRYHFAPCGFGQTMSAKVSAIGAVPFKVLLRSDLAGTICALEGTSFSCPYFDCASNDVFYSVPPRDARFSTCKSLTMRCR